MSGQIQRRFMAHSYLYTCPAASLVRAPFQIGGFKSAINVRYSSLLSDPMIFAISDRFCSRNSGGGVRERKGNLLGKREKPLVCPPDVNQQRGTGYASVPFGKRARQSRGGMILSSEVQKHPQSHTAVSEARTSIPMETEGRQESKQADHSLSPLIP